jgi:Putative 2OG-Fe(II) oxygenase
MSGEGDASPFRKDALLAFESGRDSADELLAKALTEQPNDGALLIAHAATLSRAGVAHPFDRLEHALAQSPDWVEGHKALSRLKAEAWVSNPLSSIEGALEKLPKHPRLWMGYLTLLGSAGRHLEAAEHTNRLRKVIADLPELRLVEARHRGFAGEAELAQSLLDSIPAELPELGFEVARNAMRLGDLEQAAAKLEFVIAGQPNDIGAWALLELCWRALDNPSHEWLCPGDSLFAQLDLELGPTQLSELTETLRALHRTRSAPLGQSVEGGTQTHGNLKLREEPVIGELFVKIVAMLDEYSRKLPPVSFKHPLSAIVSRAPEISASWSILLTKGGRHVPHLHDGGRISSAAHIAVPPKLVDREGMLELGLPPEDIPLSIDPLARFTPKPGHLVLFPSFVYHSTSPFSEGERLTVAFDAV